MNDVSIRNEARISDELVKLFQGYLEFYECENIDLEQIKSFLENNIKSNSSIIVAENSSMTICGFIQLYFIPNSLSLGTMCILNDLYVDPAHRKLGVGKMLMNYACAYCESRGIDHMELSTAVSNTVAQRLYEVNGWKKIDQFIYYERNFTNEMM